MVLCPCFGRCNVCCMALGCSCKDEVENEMGVGLEKKRTCTDLPCCFLFLAGICGLVSLWSVAVANGDIDRLIQPSDYKGNVCGKGEMKSKPLGFWPSPEDYRFYMCASNCTVTTENFQILPTSTAPADMYLPYNTTEWKSFCIPALESPITIKGYDNPSEQFHRQVNDLWAALPMIGVAAALAFIVGFLYVELMQRCLKFLVWTAIFMITIGGFFITYCFYISSVTMQDENTRLTQQVIGAFFAFATVMFLLITIFLRQRIRIAIEVINVAGMALKDMPLLVWFPFSFAIVPTAFAIVWVVVTALMFSMSETESVATPEKILGITSGGLLNSYQEKFPANYTKINYESTVEYTFGFHFFMFLWITQFCVYWLYTVIAGAIGDWYFSRKGEDGQRVVGEEDGQLSKKPIWGSVKRTTWYHSGSIAFGACIIAVVQFMRACLVYFEKQMGKEGGCMQKYCLKILHCILWCLECCMDAINKRAMILIALKGEPFCSAAPRAFKLIWENLVRVSVMCIFTGIVIFVGKLCVCFFTTGIVLTVYWYIEKDLDGVLLPAAVILVMCWVIGSTFMTVYETAVDTVFMCFLIDEKHNKATGNMFAEKALQEIVTKYEDKSKELAKKSQRTRRGDTKLEPEEPQIISDKSHKGLEV